MFQTLNHSVAGEYLVLAWTYCLSAGEDVYLVLRKIVEVHLQWKKHEW